MTREQGFAREALRALQRYDEVAPHLTAKEVQARQRMLRVQEDLGEVLGLDCTADDPSEPFLSHNSGTCPIHEWADESDQAVCRADS